MRREWQLQSPTQTPRDATDTLVSWDNELCRFDAKREQLLTYNLYTILSANFENLALLSAKKVGLGRPVNVALDSTMKK